MTESKNGNETSWLLGMYDGFNVTEEWLEAHYRPTVQAAIKREEELREENQVLLKVLGAARYLQASRGSQDIVIAMDAIEEALKPAEGIKHGD